jgi:3-carboxy-cis,cis-muconate cycloisomerase
MLEVESALARAEAEVGVIPQSAADEIALGIQSLTVDYRRLREGMEKDGVPVSALVQQIRACVGDSASDFVHFGATTQDIMDTVLVLQIRSAFTVIEAILRQVIENLAHLADHHRFTVMAGRTHSQQAVPTSFGFKVAGWLAPLLRHRDRLGELRSRVLVVQLGGAVGTLAPLGEQGVAVQLALASQLDLGLPLMPWHTQRDALAETANWLSLVTGSLAKMAQDIILLAQTEVAEVSESADAKRGSSSTMPQKHNPVTSEQIIVCGRLNTSHLASMHYALIQEHERGTHGWQMEWLTLPAMFELTASALQKAAALSRDLVVDEARMQHNVDASNGLMLAEAITFALAKFMGRTQAKMVVQEACQAATAENRHLVEVVKERAAGVTLDWENLADRVAQLGSAQMFIDQVLNGAQQDS